MGQTSVRATVLRQEAGLPRELLELPDPEVVDRVRAGERALFEVIMRRYNRRLFRVAWSILLDEGEAEDVIQDAFVRAFEHLDQLEDRSAFSTWLTRIAVHEASARRRKRRQHVPLEALEPQVRERVLAGTADAGSGVEARAIARDLRGALTRAVGNLPAIYRQVFVLRELEGLSNRETAEALGLSRTAAKVRFFRARRHLRRELGVLIGETTAEILAFAGRRCDRTVAAVMARFGGR